MKNRILALIGVTFSTALLGCGPPAAAAPQYPHFRPLSRPVSHRRPAPGSPLPPGKKQDNWRPHLQFAYDALLSASQAMQTSASPDVSIDLKYLQTALLELERLPPIFKGRRAKALADIAHAMNHLKQTPPSRQAVGFTEDAIANVQACMKMYP